MTLSILHGQQAGMGEAEAPLYVLKFGSSVLRSTHDLPAVAGEIYRQRRLGRAVIAVVSALAGETDRLIEESSAVADGVDCSGIADLVSLGEERTAALLRIACDRIGLVAEICGPEELGLRTSGPATSAMPVRLDSGRLSQKLAASGLVIVPGFVGIGEDGRRTLLGRGGSDFSAVFIGGELEAECVRLYKDVDGVYDRDPARHADAARLAEVSWADALRYARPLIQPQSVEYAASKRLPIEIEAIGSATPSRVAETTSAAVPAEEARALRIALAGYGTVGQALAARLRSEPRFEIVSILVRDERRARSVAPPVTPTADPGSFLAAEADVIVDVLSCDSTGAALCERLLPRGIDVVSASKRVVSSCHQRLARAAAAGGTRLLYSAAVGGSAAIIETVARARSEGPLVEVVGILNGTTNFILGRMAGGARFEDALEAAQWAGFAEADSSADLSGQDAAAKLALIASEAFGVAPEAVVTNCEVLDDAAIARIAASGERWLQVARVARSQGRIQAEVRLRPAREHPELAVARDEWNVAIVRSADGRETRAIGRGAGGPATAEAIVADLFDILRGERLSNGLDSSAELVAA